MLFRRLAHDLRKNILSVEHKSFSIRISIIMLIVNIKDRILELLGEYSNGSLNQGGRWKVKRLQDNRQQVYCSIGS